VPELPFDAGFTMHVQMNIEWHRSLKVRLDLPTEEQILAALSSVGIRGVR